MIARAIHNLSGRRAKPLVAISCAAIPSTQLEDELFGHEKGAFTDARDRKIGRIERADGGTFFLDDIDDMPLATQVKLLRVLQERKVRGIGESSETSVDVRVLAATNRVVEDDVKAGKFRQDLYYRLNVIRIEVPPLRARREDVGELARHFLDRCAREHNKAIRAFAPDAQRALDAYDFPGNVRELENIVERAVALASGPLIGLGDLPHEVSGAVAQPTPSLVALPVEGCDLDGVMGDIERRLILPALERSGGVRTNAAKLLGVTFRSLRYRMQKHAMNADDEPQSGDHGEMGGDGAPEEGRGGRDGEPPSR
jgi:two-component system response regulator PilR (NtrC family)